MDLSIIIVNWNTGNLLEDCLTSIFKSERGPSMEMIVVDNNSSDGSQENIKERFPGVQLVQNTKNKGFSKANNQGIKIARGDYILLLNPDTIIPDAGLLKKWLSFMDKHPETGASGCRLLYPDGTHQVGDAGFRPGLMTAFNFSFFLSKIAPVLFKGIYINNGRVNRPMEVDWICGADLLVRKSILDQVGLMNEDIFMYADDVEWGCRIKSFGHKVFYIPYLKIIHFQGVSLSKREIKTRFSFQWYQNLKKLYIVYCGGRQKALVYDSIFAMGFLLRVLMYNIRFILSKRPGDKEKALRMASYLRYLIEEHRKKDGQY